jgi:hypothetical protein
MNKVLCLLLSAFLLFSCNMVKDSGKVLLSPSRSLVSGQILISRHSHGDESGSKTSLSNKQSLLAVATENHPVLNLPCKHKPAVPGRRIAGKPVHLAFQLNSLPNQIKSIRNSFHQPLSESHVSITNQTMSVDYGQLSSYFLVAGTVLIVITDLTNPVLLGTSGIIIAGLALFIIGILLFFLWTKYKDDSQPWAISYGEFAIISLLGALATFFFGVGALYYSSFFLMAATIVLFILWLKNLKTRHVVKDYE